MKRTDLVKDPDESAQVTGGQIRVEAQEVAAVALSFAYAFCMLASFYVLRPVREEMGVQAGVQNLQVLFTGTFVGTLIAVPIFGRVAARWPLRQMLPGIYVFFAVNLTVFFFLFQRHYQPVRMAAAFFIWLSVYNVFVVSVLWSFMADIFDPEQARRFFGIIAAGGSIGAIAGPALTAFLVRWTGIPLLFLVAASLLLVATGCIVLLLRWAERYGSTARGATAHALGGNAFAGIRLTFSSSYLLGIAGLILLITFLNTVVYFEQARIVSAALDQPAARTSLFAQIDLTVNILTLITEIFLTAALVKRFGVAAILAAIFVLNIGGFVVLAFLPMVAVIFGFQVFRRAAEYGLVRPIREMLFTTISRESKYKAKNFIDVFVYRAGDALSAWTVAGLHQLVTVFTTTLVGAPVALGAALIGWHIGHRQDRERRKAVALAEVLEAPTGT